MAQPPFPAPVPQPQQQVRPSPIRHYLTTQRPPSATPQHDYVVLPTRALEELPLPMQQQVVQMLAQINQASTRQPWPEIYRVSAARWAQIDTLTEPELAEVGLYTTLNAEGEVEYRDIATDRVLGEKDVTMRVAVSARDPLAAPPSPPHQ